MNVFSGKVIALVFLAATATASASAAREAEDALRIKTSIYANKKLVTAATAIGFLNRETTVEQTFSTPYQRDIALNEKGQSAEDKMEGRISISVRPFHDGRTLCLRVNIRSHTVVQIHHYRSDALLEVLPSKGGYSAGGDFCDLERTADGLLFSLALGDDENYGEILVTPETPVQGAG